MGKANRTNPCHCRECSICNYDFNIPWNGANKEAAKVVIWLVAPKYIIQISWNAASPLIMVRHCNWCDFGVRSDYFRLSSCQKNCLSSHLGFLRLIPIYTLPISTSLTLIPWKLGKKRDKISTCNVSYFEIKRITIDL